MEFLDRGVPCGYFCFMRYENAIIDFSSPAIQERRKLPEGTISEIINGQLYVWKSSPSYLHHEIVKELLTDLLPYVKAHDLGKVCFAPFDVYFDREKTVLVPDISFTSHENERVILDHHGLVGAPDLIIEVLSPTTRRRDMTVKKRVYESAGVKEYWIIDPETQDCWGYLLHNNRYDEPLMMHLKIHIRVLDLKINISPLLFS